MAIRSQSSKVFLQRHGRRPIERGVWRARVECDANVLARLAVEDRAIDPRFLLEVNKPIVDQGSAKPWPFGH